MIPKNGLSEELQDALGVLERMVNADVIAEKDRGKIAKLEKVSFLPPESRSVGTLQSHQVLTPGFIRRTQEAADLPQRVLTALGKEALMKSKLGPEVLQGLRLPLGQEDPPATTPQEEAQAAKVSSAAPAPPRVPAIHHILHPIAQLGAFMYAYEALLGHAALEMVAGRVSAEEFLAVDEALASAFSNELASHEEKFAKFTEDVVGFFGQVSAPPPPLRIPSPPPPPPLFF